MAAPRPRTPRPWLALANSVKGHSRTLAQVSPLFLSSPENSGQVCETCPPAETGAVAGEFWGSKYCTSCLMSEFPDTELSRRLRANRGRRLRPEFDARVEKALGYSPSDDDFLDIPSTDKLLAQLRTRSTERVKRTWPESEWLSLRARLYELGARLGREHSSYLAFFEDWEYLGALRVRSAILLESAEIFWKPGCEDLSLVTDEGRDGFWLDYTDPDQMQGDDEYELECWGEFHSLGDS
jgi:hypothetical protein